MKRQANILSSLITNFQTVEDVIETSSNASGSALAENEKYLDSIQGRIDLFTNSLQTMWMNFIDSDAVKFFVDLGTAAVKLIDTLGLLPSLVGGFVTFKTIVSSIKEDFQAINDGTSTFTNILKKQAQEATTAYQEENVAVEQNTAAKKENAAQTAENVVQKQEESAATAEGTIEQKTNSVAVQQNSDEKQENAIITAEDAIQEDLNNKVTETGTVTQNINTASINENTASINRNIAAQKALAVVKNIGKGLLIGAASMLVTSALMQGINYIKEASQRMDELTQSAIQSADELNSARDSVEDYKDQIIKLRDTLADNSTTEQEAYDARAQLINIQDQLIDKFGLEAQGINLVTGAIEDQIDIIDKLSQKSAIDWIANNNEAYRNAIKEIQKTYSDSDFILYSETGNVETRYDDNTGLMSKSYNAVSKTIESDLQEEYINGVKQIIEAAGGAIDDSISEINDVGAGNYYKELFASFDNLTVEELDAVYKELQEFLISFANKHKDKNVDLNAQINQLARLRNEYVDEDYEAAKQLYDEGRRQEAYANYANEYGKILEAQEEFYQSSTDEDRLASIKEYRQAVENAFKEAGGTIEDGIFQVDEDSTNAHMQKFFKEMSDTFAEQEFELNVKTNEDELRTNLETIIKESGEKGLSALNDTEIVDMINRGLNVEGATDVSGRYTQEQIDGLVALQAEADKAGISVESLINILTNLGLIAGKPIEESIETVQTIVKTYDALYDEAENYNDILSQTSEIILDNTEVTQEYKDSLIELGVSEEDLADCFDSTNKLVVKDASALKKLVSSTKSNITQNVKLAKSQARLQYAQLYKQLAELTNGKKITNKATLAQINALYQEMSALQKSIAQYSMLEHKLLGAANAYEQLAEAQEIDSSNDYGSKAEELVNVLAEAFNTAELGTEAAQVAIAGLIPDDVIDKSKTLDEQMQQIYDYFTGGTVSKLFKIEFDDDGAISSVEMTKENIENYVNELLSTNLNGDTSLGTIFQGTWDEFTLNPAITSLEEFADACNMTKEVAFAFLSSLEKYDISWLGGDMSTLLDQLMGDDLEYQSYKNTQALAELEYQMANGQITAQEYATSFSTLTEEQRKLNEAITENTTAWVDADKKVQAAQKDLQTATDNLNNAIASGAPTEEIIQYQREVQVATGYLSAAVEEKKKFEEPTEVYFTTSLDEIDRQIKEWKENNSTLSINIDTELEKYYELGEDGLYVLKVGLEAEPSQELKDYVELINTRHELETYSESDDAQADIEDLVTTLEEAKAAAENIPSTININTSAAIRNVNALIERLRTAQNLANNASMPITSSGSQSSTPSRTYANNKRAVVVDGTAHAQGSWGAPRTETALVGELGPELLVRNGHWTTIGEDGAEFTDIKKGDIIFNHKQTAELLKNGYVTSRGKAYASGTAYSGINTWDNAYKNLSTNYNNSYGNLSNASDSLSNAADSLSDSTDEFEEVFDWIEVRIEEIDEKISLLEASLENVAHYNEKNNIIDSIIDLNNTKLSNLKAGYEEYAEYAAKLLTKIPENLRDAAQNGAIAIEKFIGEADEATVETINNYREWAQKAADLKQQVEEIISTIRDLAIDKFNNAKESGDVRITVEDSQTEKLQNAVDLIEDKGIIANQAYYTAMMENSNKKIEYQTAALKAAQKALDDAVKAGQIERGSNEWYELVDELYQMQSVIDESTAELEEFQNAINDIYWDNFDELINRIDYLNNETQSLIDLMDSANMVTKPEGRTYEGGTVKFWTADDVQWTEEGIATLGLYAQQMEIAEYKARQYAEAIDDLQKDYQKGLYSENEYLEKLDELTQNQYDAIESYYDAQDAIKDLNQTRIDSIKDGIQKEIDAYSELIDKKKEELESEKDLYDFQKSTAEQTKNIADIQRKLMALSTDNSASAIAKRKQLEQELAEAKADLADSYYQRSIDDRSNALDKELEDFQTQKDAEIEKLEEYLENIEQVVADSLGIVQANASGVYDTLSSKAEEYNLTLSNAIMTPWQDGAFAVSDYQTTFDTAMSSTMDQLEAIKAKWQEIIDKMAEAATADVAYKNRQNASYASAIYTKPTQTTSKPATPNQAATTEKTIAVGGQINAGSATIYGDSNGGGGGRQYFSSDPIYTVLQEKNGYLLVRHHSLSSGYSGWFKKSDVKALASGTKKLDKSGIVNIDELGEELVIGAKNGRLTYLEKGSGVIPADITSNLMAWGELNPQDMLDRNRPSVGVSPEVHNTEINLNVSYGDILHIEEFNGDDPDEIAKIVAKQFEKHTRDLNNSLRKYVR